jgi:ubiquinone/menaquinone biosynthesis C-methylase UbiE
MVYVSSIDFEKRVIDAVSGGKKASLNANTAARIFKERPDVNIILHAHVYPGLKNKTLIDYAPGTKEDEQEVIRHMGKGEKTVELLHHGIIAVGKDLEELVRNLEVEPAYRNFPEFYDLIYKRFLQSTEFLELVASEVKTSEAILDLAAGTGDLAIKLLQKGYTHIDLADKNKQILSVAEKKIRNTMKYKENEKTKYYVAELKNIPNSWKYDAVVVRQAINYLMDYSSLVEGLKNIYDHINPGGKLIFNAPNFDREMDYPDKEHEYDAQGYHVKVKEMNLVDGKTIIHTQNCTLLRKDGSDIKKLYDINRFGIFTKSEFEQALKAAGFNSVKILGKELREYSPDSKTLYFVANK